MDIIRKICLAILIIGGINWGLIGILNFDLVAYLFGGQLSMLSRIVYSLVGLSAIACIAELFIPTSSTDN